MTRRTRLVAGACLALLGAAYALSGYAMNAGFSVASPERLEAYKQGAVRWGLAALLSLALAIVLLYAAWRSPRR